MKVLFDHQIFSYQIHGGISRYYSELLSYLQKFEVSTELALIFSNNSYLKKKHISQYIPLFPRANLKMRNKFILTANQFISEKRLKDQSFDIFHPTYYDTYFIEKNILGKKPFVLTVHDMIHEKSLSNDPIVKIKHELISKADKVIAISENTKRDILEFVDKINPEKIDVIYHGNDLSKIFNPKKSFHANLPTKYYILYVGGRSDYKNFDRFIKAFALLSKKYKDVNLICTGAFFNIQEKKILRDLHIENKVFSVVANDLEMAYLYKNAVFFAFPSLYEGFGIPILEAFSLGCPTVISNTSCFPEIAGDAASYFDPYNIDSIYSSMEEMLTHTEKRRLAIEKGYEREERFSWEKTAAQTAKLYKSLI